MDVRTLRDYRRNEPFQPARIHLAYGGAVEVHHPQLLLVTDRLVMIGIPSPDHPELPDVYSDFKLARPDEITRIELLAEPSHA